MKQKQNKVMSKKLLKRIKKLMKDEEMRWKDISNFFGQESASTVFQWFKKEEIPRNRHKFVDLFLSKKKY